MTRDDLHNAIRILHSLDFEDVKAVLGWERWLIFKARPGDFFITCDDVTCDGLWRAIEKRASKETVVGAIP